MLFSAAFTASDPGGLYGTFTLTITVTCINQQPFFNPNTGVVVIDEQQVIFMFAFIRRTML
jgi:hypothetical protein